MIRAPPACALTAQIASICISNIDLQQFFTRESRSNSFVVPNFTAETLVEPDALDQIEVKSYVGGLVKSFERKAA